MANNIIIPRTESTDTSDDATVASFLPRHYRSDANKKFLHSTITQLTQPGQVKKVSGYIGRQYSKSTVSDDVFVNAPTRNRQNYQLEPGFVIDDMLDNTVFFKDYQDYINQLRVFGANVSDHSRLNKQEFYSWNPHINWDMFVNFQNYYWMPHGPDTITIKNVASTIATSTYQVTVDTSTADSSYMFSPDGITRNPVIALYRGQTYKFIIDSIENTFSIKTQRTNGPLNRYVSPLLINNSIQSGEITFTVPDNAPDQLFYVSESNIDMGGVFNILDLSDNSYINVDAEIIGKKTYKFNNINLSNGMRVQFAGNVYPKTYATGRYFVEGVGTSIQLINEKDLEIITSYTTSKSMLFENDLFDTTPFSDSTSYVTNPDYIVINRASNDRNFWSRNNKWIHKEVIEKSALANDIPATYDQAFRAVRPIIEFEKNLKLFNFGTRAIVDVDVIDTVTRDAFSTIEGSLGYNIDGINLIEGQRVIFTADTDVLVTNNVYQVDLIDVLHEVTTRKISQTGVIEKVNAINSGWTAVVTGLTSVAGLTVGGNLIATAGTGQLYSGTLDPDVIKITAILSSSSIAYTILGGAKPIEGTITNISTTMDTSRQIRLVKVAEPEQNQVVLVKQGTTYRGNIFWYNGVSWNLGQQKTKSNQTPLFDIVDVNLVSVGDTSSYPGTTFKGTSIFSYKVGTGTTDLNLGFALSYKNINNIGDIVFKFALINDVFKYELNEKTITQSIDTGFLVKTNDDNSVQYVNGWETSKIKNSQAAIRLYKDSAIVNNFDIDIFDSLPDINDIEIRVYVNNDRIISADQQPAASTENNWQLVSTNSKNVKLPYYQIKFKNDVELTDIVLIKVISMIPINLNGYYEIPINVQNNPLNSMLTEFTLGEVRDHVSSIIDNIYTLGYLELQPNVGNLRDLGPVSAYGTRFVQHSGPASLSLYHITSDTSNVIRAIEQSRDDYCKFKKSFLTVSETLGVDTSPVHHVNLILQELFINFSKTSPYYFSDMIPYNAKTQVDFTVSAPEDNIFSLSAVFDLQSLSSKAVGVYLNDVQLIHGKEYTFNNQGFVVVTASIVAGDVVSVYEYDSTDGCLVPETPTKLGLWPKYEPKLFLDTSLITPRMMIQGHDGSLTLAYDDFRDELLLELEKRIYNNIKVQYDPHIFDLTDIIPSYSRKTDYSLHEFNDVLMPNFNKWAVDAGVDFSTLLSYDKTNSFTFNYNNHRASDGRIVPAFWRGIYQWMLDTDRPHLCPWEMLGFSEEPAWWIEVYGPAPYTGNNLVLWDDISNGLIKEPNKSVVRVTKYIKPYLLNHIPVDEDGNLISPYHSGLVSGEEVHSLQGDFTFGDGSPIESAWRRSSHYSFSVLKTAILLYPANTIGKLIDRSRLVRNNAGQIVYADTGVRITPVSVKFPSVYLSNTRIQTAGLINYLINNINCDTLDAYTKYKTELETITAKLSYRVSAFTSKEKFNLLLDSKSPTSVGSVFIPQEDYKVILNTSSPLTTLTYSGVIITKVASGYEIKGYSQIQPFFKYYTPTSSAGAYVNIGGISESYIEWGIGNRYVEGNIVSYQGGFYRVTASHLSTVNFDTSIYVKLDSLPIVGGVDVIFKTNWNSNAKVIQYGTRITDIQDVVDFLLGYGQWLSAQGFRFNEFSSSLETVSNWETSAKEFMFWTTQNWTAPTVIWIEWQPEVSIKYGDIVRYNGEFYKALLTMKPGWFNEDDYLLLNGVDLTGNSVISLSPAANKLSFNTVLTVVDDISNPSNIYELFDASGNPITTHFLNTFRVNNEVSYSPRGDVGIYCASFYLIQREHVVIINNTTMFNDTIYNLESGYKQDKLKVSGYVSINWNGSLAVPGFVVDRAILTEWTPWKAYSIGDIVRHKSFYYSANESYQGEELFDNTKWVKLDNKPTAKLLPNWNYKASQFNDFYSLDSENFDIAQQQMAQHLVGYQKRQYLENIIQDDVSEYKFYQGMIIEKGTQNVLNKLFDVLSASNKESLEFYEEWAVRTGQYGACSSFENIEFVLPESKFTVNPQGFNLVSDRTTESNVVIQLIPTDIYLKPAGYKPAIWPTAKSLKTATVYARTDEVDVNFQTLDDFLNTADISSISFGQYIMCTFAPLDWNVYHYVSRSYTITDISNDAETVKFSIENINDIVLGSIISINDSTVTIAAEVSKVYVQYTNIIPTITTSSGTGATFVVLRTELAYEVSVSNAGEGYAVNETITILGNKLGGAKIANNLVITIKEVTTTGEISVIEWSGVGTVVTGTAVIEISSVSSFSLSDTSITGMFVSRRIKQSIDYNNYKEDDIVNGVKLWTDNDDDSSDFYDNTSNWKVWQYDKIYKLNALHKALTPKITQFGRSVSTTENGKIVAVSAITTENLEAEGSVMIYNNTVLQGWVLAQVLTSRFPVYNKSNFATEVAISRDGIWIALGSPSADQYSRGAVSIYKRDLSNAYSLYSTIENLNPDSDTTNLNNEQFGKSLAFGNNKLIIGTAIGNVYCVNYTSVVYAAPVYISAGSKGTTVKVSLVESIIPGMIVSGKGFTSGQVVMLVNEETSTIEVNNPPTEKPAGIISFSLYGWDQNLDNVVTLTGSLQFGKSIAISSKNTLVVSEPYMSTTIGTGRVHVYYDNENYAVSHNINAPYNSVVFGKYVDISKNDDYIAVSSLVDGDVYEGRVEIYGKTENGYILPEPTALVSPTVAVSGEFGSNLKFANDYTTLVVGYEIEPLLVDANFTDVSFSSFFNNAYSSSIAVFDRYESKWLFSEHLTPPAPVSNNRTFGAAVVATPTGVIVGAPGSDNQLGVVYEFVKPIVSQYTWNIKNKHIAKPDITKIKQAFLYNKRTNKLVKYLDIVDPIQDKHVNVAEREIKYKFSYDPAVYTTGNTLVTVDAGVAWTTAQVGSLWWDLRTAKFVDNFTDNVMYRNSMLSTLAYGASVDIYEWVASRYKPSEWDKRADTDAGLSLNISGKSLYGDDVYSELKRYDTISQTFSSIYYFWVKNKEVASTGRSISAATISKLISNPKGQGYEYLALTGLDSFSLVNVKSLLSHNDVVLSVEYWTVDNINQNIHTQWKLISNALTTTLPGSVEEKWFDSLCGKDINNRIVPDQLLPMKLRYGIENRPRQSMFVNRFEALKQLIEQTNIILKSNLITDTRNLTNLKKYDIAPSEVTRLYDTTVDTYEELRFSITKYYSLPILTPIIVNGNISSVVINDAGRGYLIAPTVIIYGNGSNASIKTVINEIGQIVSIIIENSGFGYDDNTVLSVRTFSTLVLSDSTSNGNWSIYSYNTSNNLWFKILTASYDVNKYWNYVDWYETGYNQFTIIQHSVNTYADLYQLDASIGDNVKIRITNSGRWVLLKKYQESTSIDWTESYKVIGSENGTIQFSSLLYNFKDTAIGYDGAIYDSIVYDNYADVELRIILNAIKTDLLIGIDLKPKYLDLFFTSVRYALSEQTYIDWIFKTSFVNVTHNVGNLHQSATYKNDNLSNFEDYVSEVKPYRTQVREYTSVYDVLENSNFSVSDFDLPAAYDSTAKKIDVVDVNSPLINTYPWKNWVDNVGYSVIDIKIINGGSEYVTEPVVTIVSDTGEGATARAFIVNNQISRIKLLTTGLKYTTTPIVKIEGGNRSTGTTAQAIAILGNSLIRTSNIKLKFDRIYQDYVIDDLQQIDTINSSIVTGNKVQFVLTWLPDVTIGRTTVTINGLPELRNNYTIGSVTSIVNGHTVHTGVVTFKTAPAKSSIIVVTYYKNIEVLTATDRIHYYYNPTSGNIGKDLPQLMSGIDYGGVVVGGLNFDIVHGWDSMPYYSERWDNIDPADNDYTVVVGSSFSYSIALPYVPEIGTRFNVYYKKVDTTDTVRVDASDYSFGLVNTNVDVVMLTPVTTGESNIIELPGSLNVSAGDTIIIRKETSDGSVVNDYDTLLSGGNFAMGSAAGITPEDIVVDGDEFYSTVNGYGPEEVVPGQVVDTLAIKVYTKLETGAFMQFKDMLNTVKYTRLERDKKTKLAKDLLQGDTTITLVDSTNFENPNQLANRPGVIDINGERIEFFTNENNTLGGLRRGTMGTGVASIHKANSVVQEIGSAESISYTDTVKIDQFTITDANITILSDGTAATVIELSYIPKKSSASWVIDSVYGQTDEIEVFVGGYKSDEMWESNVSYLVNDIVNVGVYAYRCIVAHTSSVNFKNDRNKWIYFIGNIRLKKAPYTVHNINLSTLSSTGDIQFNADFAVTGASRRVLITCPITPGTLVSVIRKTGVYWQTGSEEITAFINAVPSAEYEPPTI